MGQDFSKEYSSTCQDPTATSWQKTARTALKSYYLGYEGVQWHEYSSADMSLLTTKICFALFGPPTKIDNNNNNNIETRLQDVYTISQRETANKIKDKIMEIYNTIPGTKLRIGTIFISCQQSEKEFLLPIFRVYIDKDSNNGEISNYIDTDCRVYKSWEDWKNNNKLPALKYCYPSKGFYTCSQNNTYKFDPQKEPDVEFGISSAGDLTGKVARQLDILSSITSLGSGGIAIVGMFTPLAPVILAGSAVVATTAAIYGAGRSIDRLIDKGNHGESLTDLESLTCWLAIILTPVHFGTSLTNGVLAAGARNSGRIFSSAVRTAATILNLTTFGLDSIMIVIGLANLIEKADKNQLTTLDVVQFSLSLFFFGHTLIEPKTASGIIKAAQNEHINAYKNSMTDLEAQTAFQNFIDRNRGNGDIKTNSKIVRTINRINDPDAFFKGIGDMGIDLGGRKGRTVILNDRHGQSHRVNPNRTFFDTRHPPPINPAVLRDNLARCFDENMLDVQLNGVRIFENMSEHQMQRVQTVLGGTARGYNQNIVNTAKMIAQQMNYRSLDDFLCVVELVACELRGSRGTELMRRLNDLQGVQRNDFIQNVRRDLAIATQIAEGANISFANPLKAVYHFRKHGNDFPTRLPDTINFYLTEVPQTVFQDAHLVNISVQPDGVTIKTYITSTSKFGVLMELPGNRRCIATLFRNPRAWRDFTTKLIELQNQHFEPSMVNHTAKQMANSMGLASVLINVGVDGESTVSLHEFANNVNNPEVLQQMARLLCAMTLDEDDK